MRLHRPGDDRRRRVREGDADGPGGARDRRAGAASWRRPDAWIVDFTNPVGIVTRALLDAGHRAVGLCNVAISFQRAFAAAPGRPRPTGVVVDQVGLNHLTWVRAVWLDGRRRAARSCSTAHGEADRRGHRAPAGAPRASSAPSPPTTCATSTPTTRCSPSSATGVPRAEVVAEIERELLELYRDPALAEKPALLEQRGGAFYSEAATALIGSLFADTGDVQVVDIRNGEHARRAGAPTTSSRSRRGSARAGPEPLAAAAAGPGAARAGPARRRLRAADGRGGRRRRDPVDRPPGAARPPADRPVRARGRAAGAPGRGRGLGRAAAGRRGGGAMSDARRPRRRRRQLEDRPGARPRRRHRARARSAGPAARRSASGSTAPSRSSSELLRDGGRATPASSTGDGRGRGRRRDPDGRRRPARRRSGALQEALGGARLGAARSTVANDTFAVLRAGTDAGWGVAIVCGAGINCVGVDRGRARASASPPSARSPATGAAARTSGSPASPRRRAAPTGAARRRRLERAVPAHFGLETPPSVARGDPLRPAGAGAARSSWRRSSSREASRRPVARRDRRPAGGRDRRPGAGGLTSASTCSDEPGRGAPRRRALLRSDGGGLVEAVPPASRELRPGPTVQADRRPPDRRGRAPRPRRAGSEPAAGARAARPRRGHRPDDPIAVAGQAEAGLRRWRGEGVRWLRSASSTRRVDLPGRRGPGGRRPRTSRSPTAS